MNFRFFFLFFVVFGFHFREICAVFIKFYRGFVASGNSPGTRPAFQAFPAIPAIPVIPAKWVRRVRRGPSLPHALGARMTVVHVSSLKLILVIFEIRYL